MTSTNGGVRIRQVCREKFRTRSLPTRSGSGTHRFRRRCYPARLFRCQERLAQEALPAMLTIQPMPKRSTSIPNSSPHICFSSGTVTVAPSPSLSQ